MTILLDTYNKKVLSISSGGFVNKSLNTREYNGEIPESEEYEWDDVNKKIIIKE